MVHNFSAISNHASSGLTINETAWPHGGCGPVKDGLMKIIEVNTNVTKVGKIVVAIDAKILIPRACVHRHTVHNDEVFTQEGPREVKMIMDKIHSLVIDDTIFIIRKGVSPRIHIDYYSKGVSPRIHIDY